MAEGSRGAVRHFLRGAGAAVLTQRVCGWLHCGGNLGKRMGELDDLEIR